MKTSAEQRCCAARATPGRKLALSGMAVTSEKTASSNATGQQCRWIRYGSMTEEDVSHRQLQEIVMVIMLEEHVSDIYKREKCL